MRRLRFLRIRFRLLFYRRRGGMVVVMVGVGVDRLGRLYLREERG